MLTLYIADAERGVSMKNLSPKEAITILESMRIDIPLPKAAVTQMKRNLALDMAINALNCSDIPNNSDTISRQQAIDALRTCYDTETVTMDNGDEYINYGDAVGEIEQLPSVQPERKKGKWVYNIGLKQFFCDQCGEPSLTYDDIYIYSMDFTNFCPNCGADMRGEQNVPETY